MFKKIFQITVFLLFFVFLNSIFIINVRAAEGTCCCAELNNPDNIKEITLVNGNCDCGNGWSETECPAGETSNTSTPDSTSKSNSGSGLTDPLGLNGNLDNLWVRLIKLMLGFVGIASLVTFVYAGFLFLISTGNAEQIKKAKTTIIYAVLGIFLSMGVYVILSFVLKVLEGKF